MTENRRSPDDKEQSARFVEAAHEIEADETGKLFQRAFRKVVPKAKKKKAFKASSEKKK